jgi:hypothetical protein
MLPKWKEIEPMVLTLLNDEVPEGSTPRYDPGDVVNWWNNGQIRLATMKPQQRHRIYKYDDGCEIDAPDCFYRVRGIFHNSQAMPRINMEMAACGAQGFYVIEEKIIIAGPIPAEWYLIYDAYFPSIRAEDSPVHVPMWAHEACALYVCLQAITREAITDARYRKFVSPEDAPGNPTHNPFTAVAELIRDRFYEIVNTHSNDDGDFQ